jgi:signal transduction histidine kinase
MRLVRKLAIAWIAAMVVVLAISEMVRETRERALLAAHVDPSIRDALLRDSAIETGVTIVVLAAIAGLLAWGLGAWLVGRPVDRLVEKTRRIAEGDFAGNLPGGNGDELALLGREINHMCQRLDDMQQRLVQETQARVAAVEQVRHADRLTTVGTLAAGLAHEFGTPLNVISARANMILRDQIPKEQVPDSARSIVEASARLTKIVRQLLDFARRKPPLKASCDLRELATRTVELLSDLARRRGVTVQIVAGPPVEAVIDRGRIEQALTNLVVNALHATSEGGLVQIDLGLRDVVRPGVARAAHRFLRVSDDGCGIPRELRERVFEPFFTTKPVSEGTGLGLAVTYGIVEEHGGFIELQSEEGAGSTFVIWLPPPDGTRAAGGDA